VRFTLYKDRLVATLKDMTEALVVTIESLCVDTVEKLHALGEVGKRGLDEEVIVV
jgi:hypothetical protein